MTGPKHLWSGDWQQESAAASDGLADRRVKPADPEPAPSRVSPKSRRARSRRALLIALSVVLLIAAGAWGLTSLLGSSGPRAATTAQSRPPTATQPSLRPAPVNPIPVTPTTVTPAPTTTPVPPARPINWLGMQIETVAPGAAVIDTVRPGGEGDIAGLEPGDVILDINNRPIHSTSDIAPAIGGLHAGDRVTLEISHGSTLYQTVATLAAPPSAYP